MTEPVEGLSPMTRLIRWRSGVTHETWRIVQPLLDAPPAVEAYKPGWWGADKLLSGAQTPPHRCLRRPRRRAVAPASTSSNVLVSLNDVNTAWLIAAFDSGVTSLPASR